MNEDLKEIFDEDDDDPIENEIDDLELDN